MTGKILQQGAEALIILNKGKVIKRRTKKSYRLDFLDERLRSQRTRSESKLLEKASKVIPVPNLEEVNEKNKEIIMEFLDGKKLSAFLDSFPLKKQKEICNKIGENIAKLHDSDIIHGDLTTSNMILVESLNKKVKSKRLVDKKRVKVNSSILNGSKIYFIDFGLSFISSKAEDKAVDLHLLRQALEGRHFKNWTTLFGEVKRGYTFSKKHIIVLNQLEKVEKRGRYKDKY